jgi:F0F1-type ATP synthase membrane subunit b/b'
MNDTVRHYRHLEEAMHMEVAEEIDGLIRAAEEEAAGITEAAKRAARERLRTAVRAMRTERRVRLDKAHARLQAARRSSRQALQAAMIEGAMTELTSALERRWQNHADRHGWCLSLIDEAQDRLEQGRWKVEHPTEWDTGTEESLVGMLKNASGALPAFEADPQIEAGIRIRAGNSCLDGTIDGLLARRTRIKAALLALFDEALTAEEDAS